MAVLKKFGVVFAFSLMLLFALISFALAVNESALSQGSLSDKEITDIQNTVKDIPITESGEIDTNKLKDYQSKFEKNIETINAWIASNASWLRYVFGMVPEVSWLFFINFLIMAIVLNILVFRGHHVFVFLSSNMAKLAGFAVFVALLVLKVYLNIATFIRNAFNKWWMLLIAIAVLIAINYAIEFFFKFRKEQEEKEEKDKEKTNRNALDKFVTNAFKRD